ncbi:CvpA family protein [Pseudalkalibacillus caeni]|uniref:CvpA family protein n=1 Tax=Exobacillus caeni TaxID=2574798 RepID=A0A5R9F602_9BACL|nr:CvpA family protein [Pseudalkalibacillus caeni]TLS39172.1 CvpA family protein [Pseudalkalibacillus caeni]
MVDLILLVILVGGFLVGIRRGLILQVVHLTGFIVSFIVAYMYFGDLAPHLKLWIPYPSFGEGDSTNMVLDAINFEATYYRGIAFAMLFFGTKIIMQIIGSMLDFLADLPILRTINGWLGGVLGFIEVYVILFIFLFLAALVPNETVQTYISHSFLAESIVKHTPILSEQIKDLWSNHVV